VSNSHLETLKTVISNALMLGNFFRRSADHKQRVHREQNVAIDSAASVQVKYSFRWLALEIALSVCKVRLLVNFFLRIYW